MRTPIMAGNWKMYKTAKQAADFVRDFKKMIRGIKGCEVLLCPPFTALETLTKLAGKNVLVGAQNFYYEEEGAFTGEVSADMLLDIGVTHVIIGHSERRQFFGETNASCNQKIKVALSKGLVPIYCVGESWGQRRQKKTNAVIEKQIREGLVDLPLAKVSKVVVAYEPIWAIGTGKTATPEIAQDVHAFIRTTLTDLFGKTRAGKIRIQYGGSVKPANVDELMAKPDIDGALVGGASLKPDSFARIAKFKVKR